MDFFFRSVMSYELDVRISLDVGLGSCKSCSGKTILDSMKQFWTVHNYCVFGAESIIVSSLSIIMCTPSR